MILQTSISILTCRISLELTRDIDQLQDKELVELWKAIGDGLQDDRLSLLSCGEGDGARCVGKLLPFLQSCDGVIGK